jgi:hypothetical protein
VLHRVVRDTLPELVEAAYDEARGDSRIPRFVVEDLEGYLRCGLLSEGFLRAGCGACKAELLIGFSCKSRLCPSCQTRRMEDATEHLVRRVLPPVPVRQWVRSLPYELRAKVAYERGLMAGIVRILVRAVFAHLRRKSGLGAGSKCGAIVMLQRFGGALNLNPHAHGVFLDGVYEETEEGLVFRSVAARTSGGIEEVSARIGAAVRRRVARTQPSASAIRATTPRAWPASRT